MSFLPTVVSAEYRGEYRVHLRFHGGVEKTVDFSQRLNGSVFEPLRDVQYFQRFFVDGGAITWPHGANVRLIHVPRPRGC